ncbi:uncharacterized protein LOC122327317 isoform X2 [Puntigrus tetrazona]|uniref:uncharacterized protein LOC122327317 isoform X2 n=1 Tax=Puntigrus tetrazona TaxID=1606681 RepID=UPI001C8A722E|nr:uncharacterized protein LOC122327317 isoform X2 [Puntigrus tetrazona]
MNNFILFMFLLIVKGVFGDADVVSVNEGDSVTLHTGLTEIQRNDVIDWRFGPGSDQIARINRPANKADTYDGPDERFRGRLELDNQTGSLTIRDIITTDSGLYKVDLPNDKTLEFSLSVTRADAAGPILVMKRDSVTLKTEVPDIHRYDEIQWSGQQKYPIAEINRTAGIFSTSDGPEERFRDRLQLDCLTGSLTIRNIESSLSGLYEVNISGSKHTIYKTFSVMVSGALETVSVMEGYPVTLSSALTEIQVNDIIQWKFGDTRIANVSRTATPFYEDDARFEGRLKVNHQTGSLTITETNEKNSGLYKLQISSGRRTILRTITVSVTVTEMIVPVMEGESVTLESDIKIQRGDEIQWIFEDCVIAGIKGNDREIYINNSPDDRFKERLELKRITGSLTIKNIRPEHAGIYKLKIGDRRVSYKTFSVKIIEMKTISEFEGNYITLRTNVRINRGVRMLWLFGDENSLIANIKGGTEEIIRYDDVRFRGRLVVHERTGDLTITNITTVHAGIYKLKISSDEGSKKMIFSVSVKARREQVKEGTSVFLKTYVEIQENDQILWTFGAEKSVLVQFKEGITTYFDERFRGRLQLDKKTGDLTIADTRAEHTGLYEALIFSSRGTSYRRYDVVMYVELVSAVEEDTTILNTGLPDIEKNSRIVWMFRDHDSPIAEIKRGTGHTPKYDDGPNVRFRDRLKLDEKTGSLTITDITPEHAGDYQLHISNDEGSTSKRFYIGVMSKTMTEEQEDGDNDSAIVEIPPLNEGVPDGVIE